jgi:hypothetical protein
VNIPHPPRKKTKKKRMLMKALGKMKRMNNKRKDPEKILKDHRIKLFKKLRKKRKISV